MAKKTVRLKEEVAELTTQQITDVLLANNPAMVRKAIGQWQEATRGRNSEEIKRIRNEARARFENLLNRPRLTGELENSSRRNFIPTLGAGTLGFIAGRWSAPEQQDNAPREPGVEPQPTGQESTRAYRTMEYLNEHLLRVVTGEALRMYNDEDPQTIGKHRAVFVSFGPQQGADSLRKDEALQQALKISVAAVVGALGPKVRAKAFQVLTLGQINEDSDWRQSRYSQMQGYLQDEVFIKVTLVKRS